MHHTTPEQPIMGKRGFLRAGVAGACALGLAGLAAARAGAAPHTAQKGLVRARRSPWFTELGDGLLRCDLCPRLCRLAPGERGPCRVRENRAGAGYSLVYGNPALLQLDPVERKPFFHVLPGTRALSVSTAGCNMACKFCEVWDMAQVAPEDVYAYDVPPEAVVGHARAARASAVSYAFGEPVVFLEYMQATAERARAAGLLNLLHTGAYVSPAPLRALCPLLDAANVDLKGFDAGFYRTVCGGELAVVLDNLIRIRGAGVHLEITCLLIPTLNDDIGTVRRMCRWIARELGRDTPVHFARFYPLYQLANLPPTPVRTLDAARAAAADEGLEYVYVARVTGHEAESTFCPRCRAPVIRRTGFVVEEVRLMDGACAGCGHPVPGRWERPDSAEPAPEHVALRQ